MSIIVLATLYAENMTTVGAPLRRVPAARRILHMLVEGGVRAQSHKRRAHPKQTMSALPEQLLLRCCNHSKHFEWPASRRSLNAKTALKQWSSTATLHH
eukprot:3563204-Pyramimonas_sp.AAC.1